MQCSVKVRVATTLAVAAGTLIQATPASATPILQVRCQADALDPATARLRLEWARACGARINVIDPIAPIAPAQAYLTGANSANGGIPLWEYIETNDFWGRGSYSGDIAAVNQMFTTSQWRIGPYTATTVAGGFQKWTEADSFNLARPTYPTFGNNLDINTATQLFPHPTYNPADCNLYLNAAGTMPANTTVSGFYVNGYCTSSCYLPDQEISFSTGNTKIIDALNALKTGVTTLAPSSTLTNVQLTTDDVFSYTRELRDATHVIFDIRTQGGGQLRVTDKHPVVEGSGRIVEAQALKVGQKLIKADGSLDKIVSVTKTHHFGKVYNLKPKATDRVSNLLIAQGFVVGSSRYQNEDVEYVNRIILGRGIPKDVIPQ